MRNRRRLVRIRGEACAVDTASEKGAGMSERNGPVAARAGLFRGGLLLLAASQVVTGLWALVAPRSFYDDFPGAGRSWVSALGPYDEHLVRDVGASFTALVVLLVLAAAFLELRLVQAALVTWLVYSIPHFAYHVTTTDAYSTGDNVASLAGLALQVVLPAALLAVSFRAPAVHARAEPAAGSPP